MAQSTRALAEITRLTSQEIAQLVAHGDLSAAEVVEAHIERIEAVNPRLNAVVVKRYDAARAEAAAIDRSRAQVEALGPLGGVPMTVKESFDVAGTATTAGLTARAGHRAAADAEMVARLRGAGAILLGKTNVPQLLMANETDNPLYGRTNNPWSLDRAPGGSSGGEAAILAAGGSALGLGTDFGGSVRLPASSCGVHALKPTTGRLTLAGHVALRRGQEAILSQPGPIARRVTDLSLAMRLLAAPGQDRLDVTVPPSPWREPAEVELAKLRVGFYVDNGFFAPAAACRRAVREAAAALAARGVAVEPWTPPDAERAWEIYLQLVFADGMAGARRALRKSQKDWRMRRAVEIAALPRSVRAAIARVLEWRGQARLAKATRRIERLSLWGYWEMVEERNRYRAQFLGSLDAGRFDAILCPADALPALRHGSSFLLTDCLSYTAIYNLLGMPAGVVAATRVRPGEESNRPTSRDLVERAARRVEEGSAGLPVGVQVAARHWREDVALALMAALEEHFRQQADYPAAPPI